jgi:hypothetical protein
MKANEKKLNELKEMKWAESTNTNSFEGIIRLCDTHIEIVCKEYPYGKRMKFNYALIPKAVFFDFVKAIQKELV